MNFKKINFKKPKYIFPLVILPPLLFLGYELTNIFGGPSQPTRRTDNINAEFPEAGETELDSKLDEMDKRGMADEGYTAIYGLGQEEQAKDSTESGYTDHELDKIAADNAERARQAKEMADLNSRLASARRNLNPSVPSSSSSRRDEIDSYMKDLQYIQQRTRGHLNAMNDEDEDRETRRKAAETTQPKPKPVAVVTKVEDANAKLFNTIREKEPDDKLIKAMIDQTTKASEGTRIRFKLLDDIEVKGIKLPRGTYLYGVVTGFGQQRVMATISNILVGEHFIRINLSVFDNDGMEGFYVPESTFRNIMRDAGAAAVQNNMNMGGNMGATISAEAIALQTLQNMYQSASSAVSNNMRRNKARIKYNTIVYLINTQNNE